MFKAFWHFPWPKMRHHGLKMGYKHMFEHPEWFGIAIRKQLSPNGPRLAHKPKGLGDIVGRWVTFSLGHYTRKPLQRLLGRIGWLARPGFSAGCLLAGARAWLRLGLPSARCVLFAVCRGLLEAIAAGGRGWEPQVT